jgi:hypothetical protein
LATASAEIVQLIKYLADKIERPFFVWLYDGVRLESKCVCYGGKQNQMSTDRTTEMLNYLSAISREIGEMRNDMNKRLERIEREQRLQGQRLDRIEGMLLIMRSDVSELQDRVGVLESKQT